MLSNLFSVFYSSKWVRAPSTTPRYRPSGITGEEHFNLLASLQMAVRDQSLRCEKPSSAAEMLHGTNEPNLRKQGRLCLTFALKNYTSTSAPEKIRIANELEEAIDAAYSEEDYRHRIYRIGGYLNVISPSTPPLPLLASIIHNQHMSKYRY
ncbi:hypothetical protein L873DRAFT_1668580 [Choiromyces venosus 120613-1]|uniref:Uncharacterized protein n=1 Tax=Choiromyces venosus 120613-1 TaxID=1336337 RepID=A0A3N4JZU3_9PEZI|nr:hypothetical protein L873DRAFT_1668580 [Choiromyces venosus 120613-1]